ncbi:hypothetical protein [Roseovarius indicus]|uniref:hypothetical protein n=1 Tax=Roseovarius indicus TaxID=540747 RepID=UPI0032ED7D1E
MEHRYFRRFLDALDDLNPAQIEDAQTKIRNLRRKTEATSEIEARTNEDHKCPFLFRRSSPKVGTHADQDSAVSVQRLPEDLLWSDRDRH